ncbi:putative membrane protein [Natronoarchaeum philippinense]|uniref:Putative membrane protein n=2 Tax=Natronoarchaeum philippinense TaxID=558529 RepID=A0A285N726_NATPI|nr:putative membrane protein [Natronoarchaeum philippinense]
MEVIVDPELTARALAWVACGATLGTFTGLIPGIHANNVALVLASLAPGLPGTALGVGIGILSAGVVHTFVNVVPALALGVPDAETAATTLPGHRLVLAGRGEEAIRLSALGSGLAVLAAVPLAIPLTRGMTAVYPTLSANVAVVLGAVLVGLVAAESGARSRLGGLLAQAGSGALGVVALDLDPAAPLEAGGMLAPLFAGLFGAPILLEAMDGGGVPRQTGTAVRSSRRRVVLTAVAGAMAGAIVGYLPAVSAAIAAVAVLACVPGGDDDRAYVVATSGVDTANAIFALVALVALGQPRSGVIVAFEQSGAPLTLAVLVPCVVLAGALGFLVTLLVGDRYLRAVGRVDQRWLSVGVLAVLGMLSWLFAGTVGVLAFLAATAVGLVPARLGARRVHLMGVLLVPLLVWSV